MERSTPNKENEWFGEDNFSSSTNAGGQMEEFSFLAVYSRNSILQLRISVPHYTALWLSCLSTVLRFESINFIIGFENRNFASARYYYIKPYILTFYR